MRKIKSSDKIKSEEAFINAVDNLESKSLNPDASHNYKQISLPMNEYVYKLLEEASKKEGRSQKNFLRLALIERAKLILK